MQPILLYDLCMSGRIPRMKTSDETSLRPSINAMLDTLGIKVFISKIDKIYKKNEDIFPIP